MLRATKRRYGANSSEELSGHRAKSNSAPAALPSQVTEISPGTACNSFRALPRLRRAQTGRKKAPYPQIVYLLIRENNWAEFIISRVPAHRRCARALVVLVFAFVFTDTVSFARAHTRTYAHTARFIPPISSSVLLHGRYISRRSDNV